MTTTAEIRLKKEAELQTGGAARDILKQQEEARRQEARAKREADHEQWRRENPEEVAKSEECVDKYCSWVLCFVGSVCLPIYYMPKIFCDVICCCGAFCCSKPRDDIEECYETYEYMYNKLDCSGCCCFSFDGS